MAVAAIIPTACQLTKIGKIQSAGCQLCRIAPPGILLMIVFII